MTSSRTVTSKTATHCQQHGMAGDARVRPDLPSSPPRLSVGERVIAGTACRHTLAEAPPYHSPNARPPTSPLSKKGVPMTASPLALLLAGIVSMNPSSSALPGQSTIQQLTNGLGWWALIASLVGLVSVPPPGRSGATRTTTSTQTPGGRPCSPRGSPPFSSGPHRRS